MKPKGLCPIIRKWVKVVERVKVEIIQTGSHSGTIIEVELGEEIQVGPNPAKIVREGGCLELVTAGMGRPMIGYWIREVE